MSSLRFGYVDLSVDPLTAVEYGVLAEKYGFDSLWVPDHFVDVNGDKLEPWTTLSAVAARTKRISLGSAVTDIQRTHPARTAHLLASLDAISRGRSILGIGAGEAMNIVSFGLPWEPPPIRVERLREGIQVIRLLWSSSRENRVDFDGNFYRLHNSFLSQSPIQKPYPPIYVGALGSKMALQLAGALGDGWYAWLNTPDTFRRRWIIVTQIAQQARRAFRRIDATSQIMVAFPRNTAERRIAWKAAKSTLLMEKSILASLGYHPTLQVPNYQNLEVEKETTSRIMDAVDKVPDDAVYETMSIGGRDEVEEKIEDLAKAGLKHFVFGDLLAPRSVRKTLAKLNHITKRYK